MNTYDEKACMNCLIQFVPTGANQKYCEACRPAMELASKKRRRENEKYRKAVKKRKARENGFNSLDLRAKNMGVSYGKLQAMRYLGQVQ